MCTVGTNRVFKFFSKKPLAHEQSKIVLEINSKCQLRHNYQQSEKPDDITKSLQTMTSKETK